LISRAPVRVNKSNTTQPTQDGGKSGDSPTETRPARLVKLSILVTEECLPLRKTKKLNQSLHLNILEEVKLNNG
jgi:hypothetical protein